MKTLTIFCSGKTGIKQEYIDVTKKLMESLDKTKFRIAYGGGNVGLMGVVRDSFTPLKI
jgi:predicted Rossmann-fold nucleotide-binding protein